MPIVTPSIHNSEKVTHTPATVSPPTLSRLTSASFPHALFHVVHTLFTVVFVILGFLFSDYQVGGPCATHYPHIRTVMRYLMFVMFIGMCTLCVVAVMMDVRTTRLMRQSSHEIHSRMKVGTLIHRRGRGMNPANEPRVEPSSSAAAAAAVHDDDLSFFHAFHAHFHAGGDAHSHFHAANFHAKFHASGSSSSPDQQVHSDSEEEVEVPAVRKFGRRANHVSLRLVRTSSSPFLLGHPSAKDLGTIGKVVSRLSS